MKWGKFLAATLALLIAVPAAAQIKIGVVDLRQALFTSSAAQAFSKQMEKQFKGQEEKVQKAHDAAQKIKDRLDKDGAMMNDSERSKLADNFKDKVKQFKYLRDQLNSKVTKRKKAFLSKAKPVVDQALQELVKEKHLDVILPREMVIYAKPDMDLTSELIDKLNHKKIEVNDSGDGS